MADNGKIIYPELSYEIMSVAFKVFNEIGFGFSEKYYQEAFAKKLFNNPLLMIKFFFLSENLIA